MFGIIAALIGAAATVGSTIFNGIMQNKTNQQNQMMVQQENQIMREREDNSVQRRAEDLKQAGINPLLAGLGGASASSGQIVPMQAPQISLPDFGEMFRDFKEGQNFDAQNKKIKSEVALNHQQKMNLIESIKQIKATTTNIKQDTLYKLANTNLAKKDELLKKAQIEIANEQKLEIKAQTALAYQTAKSVRDRVNIERAEAGSRIRLNAQQQKNLMEQIKEIQQNVKIKKEQGRLTKKEADYYVEKLIHDMNNDKMKNGIQMGKTVFDIIKSALIGI